MVISILFLFMDHWNILPLMPTISRSLWPAWPNISKTKRLKHSSPITSKTSKISVKLLRSLFPLSIILNGILVLLTTIKTVLEEKIAYKFTLKVSLEKNGKKEEKIITNLPASKGFLLQFLLNLLKK